MNTLYVGRLISNLMPCLFDIFRINIKYVGQLLSKLYPSLKYKIPDVET